MMADSREPWIVLTALLSTLVLASGIMFARIRQQKKREAQHWKAACLKTRQAVDLETQPSLSKRVVAGDSHRSRPHGIVEDGVSMPCAAMLRC